MHKNFSPTDHPISPRTAFVWLSLLLLLGFALRLDFSLAYIYHIDEYFSMLAATMVAEKGWPILPSGLFYDQGLTLSYLAGGLIALLDFRVEVARWPSLLTSVLTIAIYYFAAKTLFQSRLIGLLAATLATFDELSIIWGARARMYTLAHLFVLLGLVYLLKGFFQKPNRRDRLLCLLFIMAALLSHTVSFMLLGPLLFLIGLWTWFHDRAWLNGLRVGTDCWLEGGLGLAAFGAVLGIASLGQAGSTNVVTRTLSEEALSLGAAPQGPLDLLAGFIQPGWAATRFDELLSFFEAAAYAWLLPWVWLSLCLSLYRFLRHRARFRDMSAIFLSLSILLVILEMGVLLSGSWQKARYMFILGLPQFILLSAIGLSQVLGWLSQLLDWGLNMTLRLQKTRPLLIIGASTLLTLSQWGPALWRLTKAQGSGHYDTAFQYLREQWQPEAKVITFHPAAAHLFLGHVDYYANQVTPLVLPNPQPAETAFPWIDRYIGKPWLNRVDQFNAILAENEQVWFVIDQDRLYRRYDPLFTEQIMAQMNWVHQAGQIYVLGRIPHPNPVPETPDHTLDISFDQLMRLEGYSLSRAPTAPATLVDLTLFWRLGPAYPHHLARMPKVFVQLRNGAGQTIAQADHFIFEGLLHPLGWRSMHQSGDWLRNMARLNLSGPLQESAGPYQLYIGFYDPETFERVPLANDVSGEQAAVLNFYEPKP